MHAPRITGIRILQAVSKISPTQERDQMSLEINPQDLSPQQAQDLAQVASAFMQGVIRIMPRVGPHVLSGGVVTIATMSGMSLRLGFEPMQGGLIVPGGIAPVNPNRRIIT